MKKYIYLSVPVVFLALIAGIVFFDYAIEKSTQQNFVNSVRELEHESIVSLDIITLYPLSTEQEKGAKKSLNRDEIARVQSFFQDIESGKLSFLEYLGARYYKRWFRGARDGIAPFDDAEAPTYSCLLAMNAEARERLNLLGSVYGQYQNYQEDLFLTNFNPGKENIGLFYRSPKSVRIKNLGQWLLETISTGYAGDRDPSTPPSPSPSIPPSASPSNSTVASSYEQPSAGPIAELQAANLSGNLIKDADFNTLNKWERFHSSEVGDIVSLDKRGNYIVWERTGSRNDEGTVGVYQNLDVDVRNTRTLSLCLDVWVDYHTLERTGWWWEERDENGQMPVEITVLYLDKTGKSHQWSHGFLIDHHASAVLWVDPDTGKWEYKDGIAAPQNITPVPKASWCHFCFDLLDEAIRKDLKGQRALPKPARLIRILLYGNGWDFRGAVGNVVLRGDRIPPKETVQVYPPTTGRRRLSPGSSSFTFTTYLKSNESKSHVLQFRKNHHVAITVSDDARIKVLDPTGKPLTPLSSTARRVEVIIPRTDYYTILFRGGGRLEVTIDTLPQ